MSPIKYKITKFELELNAMSLEKRKELIQGLFSNKLE